MASLRSDEARNQTADLHRPEDRNSIGRLRGSWQLFLDQPSCKVPSSRLTPCRTHRERKEHYIKALETEISRLRETYSNESITLNNSLAQHRAALAEHQEENRHLKEILASFRIPYKVELEKRRVSSRVKSRQTSPPNVMSVAVPASYGAMSLGPASTAVMSPQPGLPRQDTRSGPGSFSGASSGGTVYQSHHSPADPGIGEHLIKREPTGVSDMPGVFEKEPELSIDFILT